MPDDHPVLALLVRHTVCLHNQYHVEADRRALLERAAAKRSGVAVVEFVEQEVLDHTTT